MTINVEPSMTRVIGLALLLCLSGLVGASDLYQIERGNTPGRLYIERESIRRNGDNVQIWYVIDVERAHYKSDTRVYGQYELKPLEYYRSSKVLVLIDCKLRRSKYLRVKAYDRAAAQGEQTGDSEILGNDRKWEPVEKGSTINHVYPYACDI
jgi:hypothetical protein